jgi:radical SAM-linked protein
MRAQPQQQPPPVQKLRIRYAKRGRLRFSSHRDFSRAFERAVVRAALPMAYSSGFNPHPRISYAGASPTGAASEAEYLEIGLARTMAPDDVLRALDESLPDGLDVLAVTESTGGGLADRLEASRWRIEVGAPVDEVASAIAEFLGRTSVDVQRMTKKGMREFDARAAVLSLTVTAATAGSDIDLVVRHSEPAVRPDDVLAGLKAVSDLAVGSASLVTRLAQGPWDAGRSEIGDPFAPAERDR